MKYETYRPDQLEYIWGIWTLILLNFFFPLSFQSKFLHSEPSI